jgi:hypothetical protein
MKKAAILGFAIVLLLLMTSVDLFGHKGRSRPSEHYLTFTFVVNPSGLGYKHHLANNLYLSGDVDYRHENADLLFRTGGAYFFPVKILIFHFYGGGGAQFSRNVGYQYPYVVVGTHFLFFYTEMIHALESHTSPEYRFGFSVRF